MKHFIPALLALTLFISCAKNKKAENTDAPVDNVAQNEQQIKDYVTKNKLDAHRTESGLYYVINEPGTGAQPTATSNVTVAYKGSFLDGKVFDESSDGISFGLDQVIKGWTEGIPYFKTGGTGILLVPAHLGYGDNDYNTIPGGSVLVFEIKLISVN
ncbi:FKBP-type peptidyl-prolyl cis-trans isomerase [Flavobacterium hydatis]|jgi:FKBP-type peptidyl-prolyl cis-trans isomerase FkpA|uniref:Peptidyl-prolyl cis-trans isomerase n=1 Tax=Flavobacterium hydatis TaxID=991 RepID=A0A086AM19_FLAHY|nr:FKBP-type peptidyl-prolyl cis-trans isomerase [Flavobacterium hydatis]KFF17733.1 peptidylprolyl isomerase [Flavobacterium hydatis]OXA92565.1 peptidylprolyl isomerase [Flavobacterium hydatis]